MQRASLPPPITILWDCVTVPLDIVQVAVISFTSLGFLLQWVGIAEPPSFLDWGGDWRFWRD